MTAPRESEASSLGIPLARLERMPNADFTEQDLLNARVAKLQLEARKLEREIGRLDCPFWSQWSFWRSMLAAIAVGAAAWAGIDRFG